MKVLVTGGAGFVGAHLARELARAGHAVELLDDLSTGHAEIAARLALPLHRADLRDAEATERVLARGYDAVVHAAARALVAESVERPELYWDVNLRGGLILLEAMRRANVRRLVVSSSASVYGGPDVALLKEDAPFRPINPYGATKTAFEIAVLDAARAHGLLAVRLRYMNASGAHEAGDLAERHDPETHLIPNLIRAARAGSTFRIFGSDYAESPDGTCVRDLVHVEDLARAHAIALERLDRVAGNAINLGTGRGTSIQKAIATVERVLGKKIRAERAPRRPGDPGRLVADVARAQELLGWRAERDLDAIVRDAARALDRA